MISTRGRYALRVMLDLAGRDPKSWIPLDAIAADQQISKKYLEIIIKSLVRDGFVQGLRGKGGGYRLTRAPRAITVGEILESAEGGLAPVACLKETKTECPRQDNCLTLPMWKKFDQTVRSFFYGMTLQDLLDGTY